MKHLLDSIGKEAIAYVAGMKIDVTILDAKNSYGNDRYLVTPKSGSGQTWIAAKNLSIKK